jgi:sulfhydrogenase subunit beta (sulfur reductase)
VTLGPYGPLGSALVSGVMAAIIGFDGLDGLIGSLKARGYRTMGPVASGGAISIRELKSAADLPRGWEDEQAPGIYRLHQTASPDLFNWAVGAGSLKAEVFPPRSIIWQAKAPGYEVEEISDDVPPVAVVGARPCDLAGLRVLDRALGSPPVTDPAYRRRRDAAVLVAVECSRPASTCFCVSMGTGPSASEGFDLALTELGGGYYLARAGSKIGKELLEGLSQRRARREDFARRTELLARAASHMGRSVDQHGLPEMLVRNLSNPLWDEVAKQCLVCGNCTAVCPTCFCSNFEDRTDLSGTVQRERTWASCADLAYSYVHGGPVRASIKSRYRQWVTHKFSWWWDQFGTSGCVGCGRCITWCPAGIDVTEEIAALRASDNAGETHGEAHLQ